MTVDIILFLKKTNDYATLICQKRDDYMSSPTLFIARTAITLVSNDIDVARGHEMVRDGVPLKNAYKAVQKGK